MRTELLKLFFLFILLAPFIAKGQWIQTSLSSTSHIEQFARQDSTIYVATYGDGVYKTTNNGNSWTQLVTGLVNRTTTSLAVIDTLMFTGAWPGGVYRSTNSGGNWSPVNSGLTNTSVQSLYAINNLVTGNVTLLAGTYNGGIFRSTNRGQSWTTANTGLTNFIVFTFMTIGQYLFAGTDSGVVVSTDSGLTWNSSGLHDQVVRRFAVNDTILYTACTGNWGVFRSADYGNTWTRIDSTLTDKNVWDIAVQGTTLLAGTIGGGVFASTDAGTNWIDITNGITSLNVQSLFFTTDGSYVLGGTDHVGVWRRPLSEITTEVTDDTPIAIASTFSLGQNYPNPFNPTTSISFRIQHTANVTLMVFDILGREVATLINEIMTPGEYRIYWDALTKPSGTYYYRINVGDKAKTRKMVLIK